MVNNIAVAAAIINIHSLGGGNGDSNNILLVVVAAAIILRQ